MPVGVVPAHSYRTVCAVSPQHFTTLKPEECEDLEVVAAFATGILVGRLRRSEVMRRGTQGLLESKDPHRP